MNTKKYVITKYEQVGNQADVHRDMKNIIALGDDSMQVSDGYHTMDELYDHRITLFIALAKKAGDQSISEHAEHYAVWRSKRHDDGKLCFDTGTQFVLGIHTAPGKQITYHIPIERWAETNFADTLEVAPAWDGHTSAEVLERLKSL